VLCADLSDLTKKICPVSRVTDSGTKGTSVKTSDRETFIITLRPLPGSTVPPIARLKSFLKAARRQWGFQCVGLMPGEAEIAVDDAELADK